jgi:methylated-DNA-[protein]-cysteine S-methyltransferase|tara:strand:- start:1489 stop:1977 length:489 start_codon:yes stop_codon:yes gene_type:complete
MHYTYCDTPVGSVLLAGDDEGLKLIGFEHEKGRQNPAADWIEEDAGFGQVIQQLTSYFRGELRDFTVKLAPHGTSFQLKVLHALTEIPYGETRSYGELAREIGHPKAARAVGAANGRNPLPIIIPCHRVIGSGGDLVGFGGGLSVKRYLLDLESGKQQRFAF